MAVVDVVAHSDHTAGAVSSVEVASTVRAQRMQRITSINTTGMW